MVIFYKENKLPEKMPMQSLIVACYTGQTEMGFKEIPGKQIPVPCDNDNLLSAN